MERWVIEAGRQQKTTVVLTESLHINDMIVLDLQTAIAAAINLRCFAILSKRADGVIGVDLPDIGLVKEFTIAKLPWKALEGVASSTSEGAPKELDPGAMSALESYLGEDGLEKSAHVAALAILYLYMVMSSDGYR
jgi:hypothetical protein